MEEFNRMNEFSLKDLIRIFQKKPGSLWVLLGLIALGIVLLMSGNNQGNVAGLKTEQIEQGIAKENSSNYSAMSTGQQLEAELASILEAIAGSGTVKVELNLKSGSRRVWERQSRINKRVSQEQNSINTEENNSDELVIAKGRDGSDTPILKEEIAPEIQGVIIVASGASNVKVKELLTNTVMTILNLPAHRVMVIAGEMKEEIQDEGF